MKILGRSYAKLLINLQGSYKNVKFLASDGPIIQKTLCQKLSLVEYFEQKITDN